MLTPKEDSEILKKATYAAYNQAITVAFKTLSDLITQYFSEHRDLFNSQILEVPPNFRPLKDYERTLRIQNLALRLALRAADLSEHMATIGVESRVHANGQNASP
jgi:hypothetical protein